MEKFTELFQNKKTRFIAICVLLLILILIVFLIVKLVNNKEEQTPSGGSINDNEISDKCRIQVNKINDLKRVDGCDVSTALIKDYVLNGEKISLKVSFKKDEGNEYYYEVFINNVKIKDKIWEYNYKTNDSLNYMFDTLTITELMNNEKPVALIISNHVMGQCAHTNNYAVINSKGKVLLTGGYSKLELGNTNENKFAVTSLEKYYIDNNLYCIDSEKYKEEYDKASSNYAVTKEYSFVNNEIKENSSTNVSYKSVFKK